MKPLNKDELEFMGRLARSPDGQMLRNILEKRLEVYNYDCRRLDASALHRTQGRAQELEDLFMLFETGQKHIANRVNAAMMGVQLTKSQWGTDL